MYSGEVIVKALTSGCTKQHSSGSTILYAFGRLTFQYLGNLLGHLKGDLHATDCKQLESELQSIEVFLMGDFRKH
eukprot:IDg16157t1